VSILTRLERKPLASNSSSALNKREWGRLASPRFDTWARRFIIEV